MIEFRIISMAVRITLCCIVFICFIFGSLKSRYRYSGFKTGLYAAALIGITVIIEVLFLIPDRFLSDYNVVGIILWILSAVLVFCRTIKGSYFELLFIVLVAMNLYVNIVAIARILVYYTNWKILEDAAIMAVLAAYTPLLWLFWMRMYKRVIEFYISDLFGRVIWVIPALTYIVYYVKIVSDYWKKPVHAKAEDVAFVIFWSFVTYAFFAVTLMMLIQAYKGISAMNRADLVESQLRMQEEEYLSLLESIEKTTRTRHDIRHHLLTIRGFADQDEMASLKAYLDELTMKNRSEGEELLCEHHVVDVILKHYLSIARQNAIVMEVICSIPDKIGIMDIDLCIIFGNLVENAVEACVGQTDGERLIHMNAFIKGDQLALQIKNTYGGQIICKNEEYYSTKHKGVGVGISSVRRVAEKYHGIVKINFDGKEFEASLIVNTKQPQKQHT